MFKRVIWMGTGYGLGAGTSWWVKRKVQKKMNDTVNETVDRYVPPGVRDTVESRAKNVGAALKPRLEAIRTGVELRADGLTDRPTGATLTDGDAEIVISPRRNAVSFRRPKPRRTVSAEATDLVDLPPVEALADVQSKRRRWLRSV